MGQALSSQQAASAADDHQRWRQQAAEHAQRRGQLLQQSQEAYKAGRGQEAHELSTQGKAEGCLMVEANRRASEAVFQANNLSSETDVIDLHGLYVKEAKKGRHSKDGISRLKPAIETLAQQRGLPCTDGKPRPGCLWLDLPKPSLLRSLTALLRRLVCCMWCCQR